MSIGRLDTEHVSVFTRVCGGAKALKFVLYFAGGLWVDGYIFTTCVICIVIPMRQEDNVDKVR